MKISGYIIEKFNNMNGSYTSTRLLQEASRLGVGVEILGIHDTIVREDGIYNNGLRVAPKDFVINRYKGGKLRRCLNSLGKRTYNPHDAFELYLNKFEQVRRLRSAEFLVPKYVLATACMDFSRLSEALGTPFVAKGLESSMGLEVFLIHRPEELLALEKDFGMDKEWLFEEFIAASAGRDMRLFSIRGSVEACMSRQSNSDFRANVSLGATVQALEVTPSLVTIAADIYHQTGLDFVGIDLLFGETKPYLCEINVMPGFQGMERATGTNIAGRILETLLGDVQDD